MFSPPHPGAVAKRMLIDEINYPESLLKDFFNGNYNLSPFLSSKLSIALNTSVEMWINMKALYELSLANEFKEYLQAQIKSIKTDTVS